MPHLKTLSWSDYEISLKTPQNDKRSLLCINILPYFWDSEIRFSLKVIPRIKTHDDVLTYVWELKDLDNIVIKKGQDIIELLHMTRLKDFVRKELAISLGYLHPNKHYNLFVTFTNNLGLQSAPLLMASFTVKDRDEYYMQLFILLLAISFSFLLWFLGGR